MSDLEGEALIRVGHILELPMEDENLATLVMQNFLFLHGFYYSGQNKVPFIKFNKKKKSKKAMRMLVCILNGRGLPFHHYRIRIIVLNSFHDLYMLLCLMQVP